MQIDTTQLRPVIDSIIASELAAFRGPAYERSRRVGWDASSRADDANVDADSADLIGAQTAVSDFFGLYEVGLEQQIRDDTLLNHWARTAAQSFDAGAPFFAFRTSGSTGEPKRIERIRADLFRETTWFAQRWADRSRVVCTVPTHHIYGFTHGVLLPAALGVDTVDQEFSLRTSTIRSLRDGDLIVATPTVWSDVARTGMPLPTGVQGVSAGGPIDAKAWDRLLSLGLEQLTDVYGSTETSALGVRISYKDPFTALDADKARSAGIDVLEWCDEDRFRVSGRADGMVVVAGVNVSPIAVERFLESQPGVQEAAVRLVGDRLAAFVVPAASSDSDQLPSELNNAVRTNLPAPERPTSITLGSEIPTNGMGKRCSWDIAA